MTASVFVDSNVLIYAFDESNEAKQKAANNWRNALWRSRAGRVSFQVLQEFYVKITQKVPSAREAAQSEVRDLLAWRPVVIEAEILELGWEIQDRYRLSFWDALIVASAKSISCDYLLTEDLQSGQNFNGLVVLNPFQKTPDSLFS